MRSTYTLASRVWLGLPPSHICRGRAGSSGHDMEAAGNKVRIHQENRVFPALSFLKLLGGRMLATTQPYAYMASYTHIPQPRPMKAVQPLEPHTCTPSQPPTHPTW